MRVLVVVRLIELARLVLEHLQDAAARWTERTAGRGGWTDVVASVERWARCVPGRTRRYHLGTLSLTTLSCTRVIRGWWRQSSRWHHAWQHAGTNARMVALYWRHAGRSGQNMTR